MNGLKSTNEGHFENDHYVFFWNGPFSNWYPSKFTLNSIEFNCAERAMMYMKAKLFGDDESAVKILKAFYPDDQKRLGKLVKNFDESIWKEHRERIAHEFLYAKFSQNPELGKILTDTEDKTIVEASPYDKIWGIGMGVGDPNILDESKWNGLNLLGKTLMHVRNMLHKENEEI